MSAPAACDVLLIAHRWYLPDGSVKVGGIDRTKDYLLRRGARVALLEHPLTTMGLTYPYPEEARLHLLHGEESRRLGDAAVRPARGAGRWTREAAVNRRLVARCLCPGFAVIAADPLCGWSGLDLRRRGLARWSALHFTDYASQRFANPLLNGIYQYLCRANLRKQDLVLPVSTRMLAAFRELHADGRYLRFPNAPNVSECPRVPLGERESTTLALLGIGAEGMQHDSMCRALALAAETLPGLRLCVIGGGAGEDALRAAADRAGVMERIDWRGFLPRQEALAEVARCRAGLVLYDDSAPWNAFRDSIKIREYAACALPILCDPSTSTAQEAAEAGCAILADTDQELAAGMLQLTSDQEACTAMSDAAMRWATANDKVSFLEELCRRIGDLPGEDAA